MISLLFETQQEWWSWVILLPLLRFPVLGQQLLLDFIAMVEIVRHSRMHFGQGIFESFGSLYAPMVEMVCILLVLWLVAWWMYRRKIFLRI